jgi:hypothetical protein
MKTKRLFPLLKIEIISKAIQQHVIKPYLLEPTYIIEIHSLIKKSFNILIMSNYSLYKIKEDEWQVMND